MKSSGKILAFLMASCLALSAAEEPKAGELDAAGKLILHVFHSSGDKPKALPAVLEDDYGFMIFNDGTEEKPKMRVLVASKKDKKIREAATWEETEKLLDEVPSGSTIHYYGKCLCPTYWGLPEDTWDKFMALLEKRKIAYSRDEDRTTCDCPDGP